MAERMYHADFGRTSFGHRGRPGIHGPMDATATNRNANTIRLRTRWVTAKYALKRISRVFSFHEAKMLGRTKVNSRRPLVE